MVRNVLSIKVFQPKIWIIWRKKCNEIAFLETALSTGTTNITTTNTLITITTSMANPTTCSISSSQGFCQLHSWESMAFNVLEIPNTITFHLTTIIGNSSVGPTSISEVSCIVAKLVPCSLAKIYHLWYVRRWGIESQPLIASDQCLVH